jgi:radical SAM superfamily enzyme YgiQ (UPF0313 family)
VNELKIGLVFPRFKYSSGDPPLGLAFLAAYIMQNTDHKVEIIDTTFHHSFNQIISRLKSRKYDLIGIYSNTVFINDVFRIAEISKKLNPEIPIIIGGPYATVLPYETLKNKYVDAIVIGEGECTLCELLEQDLNFDDVKGIWFKRNAEIKINLPRSPIKNLDSIPFPARELLPMNKYIKNWFQLDSVSPNLKGTNVIGSRGCPYNCSYCQPTLRKLFGNKVRFRSPENIVKELIHLKRKYKIDSFLFVGDTFIINQKWVESICDELLENNLDLLWGCTVRADLVTKPLLEIMRKAGLVKICIGIESSSQRILDKVYNKGINIRQIERSVKLAKKLGLKIQGYFMLGAPTETIREIKQTIQFSKKSDIDEAMFSISTPLPGTYLYERMKDLIDRNFGNFDYYNNYVLNDSSARKQMIILMKKRAYVEFYLYYKKLLQTVKTSLNPFLIHKTINKLQRF